jgi:coenzyme F420 hydrogenase subunit beta
MTEPVLTTNSGAEITARPCAGRSPTYGNWSDLYREVASTERCTGCGACVVACPFHMLEYVGFRPNQREDGDPEACSRGVAECSVCARACPRYGDWEGEADRLLFGRTRLADEPAGVIRAVYLARATDPRARARGQDGGVVTGLLAWGLESGRLDGVITSGQGDDPWKPSPTVALDVPSILEAAGSRYTYSPNSLALEHALELGLGRVALVGTSCVASVPAIMAARHLSRWRRRIAWTFGLLCSKTFDYGPLFDRITGDLGIPYGQIDRMDIKGKVIIIERSDGSTETIPLKEAGAWTRAGCAACPDFAAEHADISFGGLGQTDRWTVVIVRTELGESIWREALENEVVVCRPLDDDPDVLPLLARMAASQRRRWPAAEEHSWSGRPGVLPPPVG